MDNGYTRHGCPTGWGAQTHPMGYRGDQARQAARVAIGSVLELLTPASWTIDTTPNARLQQHARARA
jgi:hypothetical protein